MLCIVFPWTKILVPWPRTQVSSAHKDQAQPSAFSFPSNLLLLFPHSGMPCSTKTALSHTRLLPWSGFQNRTKHKKAMQNGKGDFNTWTGSVSQPHPSANCITTTLLLLPWNYKKASLPILKQDCQQQKPKQRKISLSHVKTSK